MGKAIAIASPVSLIYSFNYLSLTFLAQWLQVQKNTFIYTPTVLIGRLCLVPGIPDDQRRCADSGDGSKEAKPESSFRAAARHSDVHACIKASPLWVEPLPPTHSQGTCVSPGISCGSPEKEQTLGAGADSNVTLLFLACVTLGK